MFANIMGVHDALFNSSRLPAIAIPNRRVAVAEIALLILFGIGTTSMSLLPDYHLRIPGHAILRSVFPMALGLALVPRRSGGTIMGASALATALCYKSAGFGGLGAGAVTSMCATGPLLDLAVACAGKGWQLYCGFVAAGLSSNLLALLARGILKYFELPGGGSGGGGGRGFQEWWMQASFTYPVCGILAGLISAAVWFKFRTPRTHPPPDPTEATT